MMNKSSDSFSQKVIQIIRQIPRGKILSYGQVAVLAGVPRAARIVGGILHLQGREKKLPWQRVINAQGKISTYRVGLGEEQIRLLKKEGLKFDSNGAIDLKKHQWWPRESLLKKLALDEETLWRIQERFGF